MTSIIMPEKSFTLGQLIINTILGICTMLMLKVETKIHELALAKLKLI